jgi:hypothetical protein
MNDVTELVAGYISQIGNADADDACRSLLELWPVALPQIQQAFRVARNRTVKLRLAQVACHSRSMTALPFLQELLGDGDTEIWKTALDGLVYVGWDEVTARDEVMEILRAAKQMADTERRDWIEEALDQVPWANRPA